MTTLLTICKATEEQRQALYAARESFPYTADACKFTGAGCCAQTRDIESRGSVQSDAVSITCCCHDCEQRAGYLSFVLEQDADAYRAAWNPVTGFWRPGGCALPRYLRSGTCLAYQCGTVAFGGDDPNHPTDEQRQAYNAARQPYHEAGARAASAIYSGVPRARDLPAGQVLVLEQHGPYSYEPPAVERAQLGRHYDPKYAKARMKALSIE